MQVVKCLGRVLSSYLLKNNGSTGMSIYEIRNIVYSVVNDEPQIFFRCVLRDVSERDHCRLEDLIPSRPPLALRAP